MKRILSLIFLLFNLYSFSQAKHEKLLFSFKTKQGKSLQLTLDTLNNVMIYRFGKAKATELEIKDELSDTIPVFTYSYYLRGGGKANAGLDLNYVSFVNKGFKYIIFSEYDAESETTDVGIRIIDLKTGKNYSVKGLSSSVKGSLIASFRWDGLIPIEGME